MKPGTHDFVFREVNLNVISTIRAAEKLRIAGEQQRGTLAAHPRFAKHRLPPTRRHIRAGLTGPPSFFQRRVELTWASHDGMGALELERYNPAAAVVMPAKKKTPPSRSTSAFAQRLRVSEGFLAFALDQLAHSGDVTPRRMFGGVGLYRGDLFFGILAGDTLYLKADPQTMARFERAGSQPFMPYPDRRGSAHYYSVPLAVLEDASDLATWVADAIGAATRSAQTRRPRRSRRQDPA